MSADRRKVLTMLRDGKLTVDEAEAMLDAFSPQNTAESQVTKLEITGQEVAVGRFHADLLDQFRACWVETPAL